AAVGVSFLAGGGAGGAAWVLRVGTAIYLAAIALALRIPAGVDAPLEPEAGQPEAGQPEAGQPGASPAGAPQAEAEELGPGGTRPLPTRGGGATGLRRVFKIPT